MISWRRSTVIAVAEVLASAALIPVIFQKWGPKSDLHAYELAFVGLLLGTFASVGLYPLRRRIADRALCTLTILITAFWALEFFGGLAWWTLDMALGHRSMP